MGDAWDNLVASFEATVGSCNVTRRALTLGERDSVTGHRKPSYPETTIKMIIIPRGATSQAMQAGTYVRLDAVGLTDIACSEGDEIKDGSIYYEVEARREHTVTPDTVEYYECDLTELSLSEQFPVLLFDMEKQDSTVYDKSIQGNHGTIYGPTSTTGYSGNALLFDGTDDYVEVADSDSLEGMNRLTVMAWIKWTDDGTGFHMIIRKNLSFWMEIVDANERVDAVVWTDASGGKWVMGGANGVPSATWTHVALVYDGTKIQLYVNGVASGSSVAATGRVSASTNKLQLGIEPTVCAFNGIIDEVKIFRSALSQQDIQREMAEEI